MEEKMLSLKEMHKIELNMMIDLHKFCEENGIRYALGYGSCLGAIRHNGFIPWDDDIDIIMPYDDYKKLIKLKKDSNDRYQIYCAETDQDCSITFAKYLDTYTELDETETSTKAIGVYIDIFPIYGLPETVWEFKRYMFKMKIYDVLMSCARKKEFIGKNLITTIVQKIVGPYAKKKGVLHYVSKMLRHVRKYAYSDSDKVGYMPAPKGGKECFSRSIMDNFIKHEFEGQEFYIPLKYDEYLNTIYGDYMELPPEDKRISHHKFTVKFLNVVEDDMD